MRSEAGSNEGHSRERRGERGDRERKPREHDRGESELIEKLVGINRVAKVVKGGRRFGFAALVVVGDGKGRAGYGSGKAREVPEAIRKATDQAKRGMIRVPLCEGRTLHHDSNGHFGAGKVVLRAAPAGTGIIAGGPMRAIFEALGVQDVVTKSIGTSNPHNMIKATFDALSQVESPRAVAARRGRRVSDIFGRHAESVAREKIGTFENSLRQALVELFLSNRWIDAPQLNKLLNSIDRQIKAGLSMRDVSPALRDELAQHLVSIVIGDVGRMRSLAVGIIDRLAPKGLFGCNEPITARYLEELGVPAVMSVKASPSGQAPFRVDQDSTLEVGITRDVVVNGQRYTTLPRPEGDMAFDVTLYTEGMDILDGSERRLHLSTRPSALDSTDYKVRPYEKGRKLVSVDVLCNMIVFAHTQLEIDVQG